MANVEPMPARYVDVHGRKMAYVEVGEGDPILFLHGNPTSSYLWRSVMPALAGRGRCIAPDLIGMGRSDKLPDPGPDTYRFVTHQRFLDGFTDAMGIDSNVTLVIHDWGSALGFDWARRHAEAVRGIAYMEAIVRPMPEWAEWPEAARPIFRALRSPAGEDMVLKKNVFVERVLTGSIIRDLSPEEMDVYRAPFREEQHRWPTLTWPRQIPLAGEPADVVEIAADYARWMASNEVRKLFINAEPGAILTGPVREFCRTWKNQQEVAVKGIHFIQEDSGPEIGRAIAAWMDQS